MKVSVITVVRNNVGYIEDCIKSVLSQSYDDIEYVVIDGESTDGTLDVVNKYRDRITRVISERDNGYAHAMNKGLSLAAGDIVGFLHSDDFYAHKEVIKKIVDVFKANPLDSLYGDLVYVKRDNLKKVVRYWKGGSYKAENLRAGWMPPHPTFFVKKAVYEKYGYFNEDFRIAADYEIMIRFLEKRRISTRYVPRVLVKMRYGGVSNRGLMNIIRKSREDYRVWKIHGLKMGFLAIIRKNLAKIPQFFVRGELQSKNVIEE